MKQLHFCFSFPLWNRIFLSWILGFLILVGICNGEVNGNAGGGKLPPFATPLAVQHPPKKEIPHAVQLSAQSHFAGSVQSLQLPQIHSPQTKLTVQVGDTVYLPCKVHNLGENHVLWKHGTNILAGSNVTTYADNRIALLEDFALAIANIVKLDEGDYECIVTSWPPLSITHSIVVHDPPTVNLLTPTNIIISESESVEIGCIPQGSPLPKITWSMRDGNIPLSIPKALLNQPILPLVNVTRAFTGLYVCTADNGVGRPAIGAVYVRVLYPPEIEIPRRRAHGGVGIRAQLVSLVHADPKPEVHWRKSDVPVTNSDRVYMEIHGRNEYRLIFNPVKASDFSTYSIHANNSLGLDIKNIEFLGVPNVPVLTRWETEDLDGIQVTLYWTTECYSSLIEYKLYFRPAKIPLEKELGDEKDPGLIKLSIPADFSEHAPAFLHTKSFTLRGLNRSTIYQAAIQARNKYGWSLLSSVCYFATFPNSSSTKSHEMDEIMMKINTAYRVGTDFEKRPERERPHHSSGFGIHARSLWITDAMMLATILNAWFKYGMGGS